MLPLILLRLYSTNNVMSLWRHLRKRHVFVFVWPSLACVVLCLRVRGFELIRQSTSPPTGMFWFESLLLKSLCSSSVLVLATTWRFQFDGNFHSSLLWFSSIGQVGWRVKKLFRVIKCLRGETYLVTDAWCWTRWGVWQAVAVSRHLNYPINGQWATLVCVQIINVTKERSRKRNNGILRI